MYLNVNNTYVHYVDNYPNVINIINLRTLSPFCRHRITQKIEKKLSMKRRGGNEKVDAYEEQVGKCLEMLHPALEFVKSVCHVCIMNIL